MHIGLRVLQHLPSNQICWFRREKLAAVPEADAMGGIRTPGIHACMPGRGRLKRSLSDVAICAVAITKLRQEA